MAIERLRENIGPIAQATVAALDADDISLVGTGRMPRRCTIDDLMAAEIIIAVKEAEHRELLAERFSGWENRTVYWHVHDIDEGHPDAALAQLKRHVKGLARRLAIPNG